MKTIEVNGVKYDLQEANGVKYYQDWERTEGSICMVEPKTMKRFRELNSSHPNSDHYGVFFAFGTEQFEEGRNRLIEKGYIKEGEKVCDAGMGMYGTESEIDRYLDFYKERARKIKEECNPQEVYFYEWNNHECMFTNDDDALECIVSTFGAEVAHTIHRVHAGTATNILAPLTERDKHLKEYEHTLMMLSRMQFDMEGFFNEGGDCRRRRPDCLWGGCVKREIKEMRDLYNKLPDDIKDASCMTLDEIENYCRRLEEWAQEEFSKPEYDPTPRTERKDFPDEILLDESLYYYDDEGNMQKPTHVWFSHDSRRWHQDERCVHGMAMTSYLGKNGTTLTKVYYIDSEHWFTKTQYRRTDLCDVSALYDSNPLHPRLYGFYHE